MRRVHVVGAVIVRGGRVLAAQRGGSGPLAGLWEFPGGKVEQDEAPSQALEREIAEELNCEVRVGSQVTTTVYQYDFAEIALTTFYCSLIGGEPQLSQHTAVKWLAPAELDLVEWAPADLPAVSLVKANQA